MRREFKAFKNCFCESLPCGLGEFLEDIDEEELLKLLSSEEIETIVEYAVAKNARAGVGNLYIKVPYAGLGIRFLDKYHIEGKELLSARLMSSLKTSEVVGGRIGLVIENILDYNEGYLADISDFTGKLSLPIFICLGNDLQEVGKLVNIYHHSPVEILEDFGFLDRECYLYGLNFIDKEDMKLLKSYTPNIVFSPRSDGEEGRGAINLYNFIYNDLKFAFSSGRCYNIDMLAEAKLACNNTANMMYERNLIDSKLLLESLQSEGKKIEIDFDEEAKSSAIFEEKVKIDEYDEIYNSLRGKVKEITKKIKEKI